MENQTAFQIEKEDNVATALQALQPGRVALIGHASAPEIEAVTEVPVGHKLAIKPIAKGESVVKYNVVIGHAVKAIRKGEWVHLHNMASNYDERSSHLDALTGAPKDTEYR